MELFLIQLFFKLFNISIAASFLILAVALFRLVFKKAPKKILCVLWAIVGLRLLLPFSLESRLSLVPPALDLGVNTVVVGDTDYSFNVYSQPERGSTDYIAVVENTTGSREVPEKAESKPLVRFNETYIAIIWAAGMGIMLAYMLISYLRVKRSVGINVPYRGQKNVFLADTAQTAFILGIVKPKIYLPSAIDEKDIPLVLAHENAHLKRFDHIIKPLGFLLLCVYWFNPLLWLAYVLLCRDIEAACDEKVLRSAGEDSRSDYSEALIRLSTKQRKITACPLAFGETGVKKRVKQIVNYKKPAFWIVITALLVSTVVGVCFFTAPRSDGERLFPVGKKVSTELDAAIHQAVMEKEGILYKQNEFMTEGHVIYGTEKKDGKVKVYMFVDSSGFCFIDNFFVSDTGGLFPCVAQFKITEKGYELEKLTVPQDGSLYHESIIDMFPFRYRYRAFNTSKRVYDAAWKQCVANAQAYLDSIGRKADIKKYGEIHRTYTSQVFNISVDKSDKISDMMSGYGFDWHFGSREEIRGGERYVYLTEYDLEKNIVILTKYKYETGKVMEYREIDVLTATAKTDTVAPEYIDASPEAQYYVTVPQELDSAISRVLLEKAQKGYLGGEKSTEGHAVFGFEENNSEATVYMYINLSNFRFENGIFANTSGCSMPVVMTFKKTKVGFELKEYKEPEEGEMNRNSINKLFPEELREYALNTPEEMIERAEEQCVQQAQVYLNTLGRSEKVGDYGDIPHVFPHNVFNITTEQSDALGEAIDKYSPFQSDQGYFEEIIGGVRYVFATKFHVNENKIALIKYEYDLGKVVEYREIDVLTARDIPVENPPSFRPEGVPDIPSDNIAAEEHSTVAYVVSP